MKQILFLIIACGILTGCGNPDNSERTKAESPAQKTHTHTGEEETIELNNGEKWKVDANMMVHINSMETEVLAFNGTTLPEYKTLSASLQQNIELLTSNCTMEGKAHDELHKWLVPFIDLVDVFAGATNEEDAEDHYVHIKTSLTRFHKYFE